MWLTDSLKWNNEGSDKEKLNNEDWTPKIPTFSDILTVFEKDLVLITKKPLLELIEKNLNTDNLNSSNTLLWQLLKSSQDEKYDEVDHYLNELYELTNDYKKWKTELVTEAKQSKDEVKKETEKETETNVIKEDLESIDDYEKFIKYFLEKNNWYIDYSISKVSNTLKEAETLNENQLVDKITWLYLPFDVETVEWDKYFKDHKIPEEKQDQIRTFYSKMLEDKDFWNLIFDDFWNTIDNEAERILSIPDWELITVDIDDLNPSTGKLEFSTKKDALLYLYYNKLLFREVATSYEEIIVWWANAFKFVWNIWEFIINNPLETFGILLSYMAFNTARNSYRYLNSAVIRRSSWDKSTLSIFDPYKYIPSNWNFLNPSTPYWSMDESLTKEQWEYKRRKDIINYLKDKYRWDEKKIKQIEYVEEKYLNILDHNIDMKDWSKWRYSEWTFWREVAYIEWTKYKWVDIPFKLFYRSTESKSEFWLKNQSELKERIKKEFFPDNNENKFIKWIKDYIELSHSIENSSEDKNIKKFEDILKDIKDWKLVYKWWMSESETINFVKNNILKQIQDAWLILETNFLDKVTSLKDSKDFIWKIPEDLKIIDKIKKDYWNMSWLDLTNDSILREIESFYNEINRWSNKYELRTAADILTRILKWKTMDEAIKESFSIKAEIIESINIKWNSLQLTVRSLFDNPIEITEDILKSKIVNSEIDAQVENENSESNKKLREKYKEISDAIKNFPLKQQFEYLKDRFWWVDKIPNYFIDKYKQLWKMINFYKISNTLKPLRLELIIRGEIEKSKKISEILDEIHKADWLEKYLEDNREILNFKDYYLQEYNYWIKTRSFDELIKILKNIDYSKLPKGINNYTDLLSMIKNSTDTTALWKISEAIKKLNITR